MASMAVHPTAIVSNGARLGHDVTVGPYAIIESDVDIGGETEIRAHAVVKRFTSVGPGNVIHEGAVLGGEPQVSNYADCQSYLRIGARNQIREGVTIHRGAQPGSVTVVGSDCFLMACSHVAHDCQLDDGVIMANNVALAGYVRIEEKAFLSGGVVVHQFCRVGRLAMVGGNAKIVQDCLPFVITDGMPGRARGLNVVGLRRAGMSTDAIRTLKQAYRTLLRSRLLLTVALARLADLRDPLVDQIVGFIRQSERGFCHE